MAINVKKSSCLRIGARRDKLCSSIHTLNGREFACSGLMKSAILVCILCAPTNSSALSTKPNGPFTEQQIVSLPKLVDWLLKRSWSSC